MINQKDIIIGKKNKNLVLAEGNETESLGGARDHTMGLFRGRVLAHIKAIVGHDFEGRDRSEFAEHGQEISLGEVHGQVLHVEVGPSSLSIGVLLLLETLRNHLWIVMRFVCDELSI